MRQSDKAIPITPSGKIRRVGQNQKRGAEDPLTRQQCNYPATCRVFLVAYWFTFASNWSSLRSSACSWSGAIWLVGAYWLEFNMRYREWNSARACVSDSWWIREFVTSMTHLQCAKSRKKNELEQKLELFSWWRVRNSKNITACFYFELKWHVFQGGMHSLIGPLDEMGIWAGLKISKQHQPARKRQNGGCFSLSRTTGGTDGGGWFTPVVRRRLCDRSWWWCHRPRRGWRRPLYRINDTFIWC